MIGQNRFRYLRLGDTRPFLYAVSVFVLASCSNSLDAPEPGVGVTISTSMGLIEVRVDTLAAPRTASNFLRYVNHSLYDGGSFFRTVRMDNQPGDSIRIEVIQGGANGERRDEFYEAIKLERTSVTGLHHEDGSISMARGGPDTATSSFFICIGAQPELDFGGQRNPDGQGFAAFGRVTGGMEIVRAIQKEAADGQSILEPVRINSIHRTDAERTQKSIHQNEK